VYLADNNLSGLIQGDTLVITGDTRSTGGIVPGETARSRLRGLNFSLNFPPES